ncbi:MAG: 3-phosphoshikimate 1-carboxyvinyltransferase, partial [Ruminococcaceae bacterium]|nr:3-phosphoshikimate 1-carboxyvinyltransferase [Oscillospiraceae bacterium]
RDHRIVMSEALLMSVTGGEIQGAEAVKKSFPDFFEKISELGIKLEKSEVNI